MNPTEKTDPDFNQPTYYGTVVHSKPFQAWEKVASTYGFDWYESVETGWLSEKHFMAFLDWYKNTYEAVEQI